MNQPILGISYHLRVFVYLLIYSSDLWVSGSVPGATDTGDSLKLSYAVGTAAGQSLKVVALTIHYVHS